MQEKLIKGVSGYRMVCVLVVVLIVFILLLPVAVGVGKHNSEGLGVLMFFVGLAGILGTIISLKGLTIVNPNEAKVLQLFGAYKGTLREQGIWFVNPLTHSRKVSLRIRNFESGKLKVNDKDGNPIEIAAIIVWKVTDTAEAIFQVDNYEDFVHVQSESAVRILATTYPYDANDENELSLRLSADAVTQQLRTEIQNRLSKAGVEVIEARISHLAYAPEIASAMLRRQQANAIIAAREKIVQGAVDMVEMALTSLQAKSVVVLDDERKAAMVSNLLVVLCGDRDAQPVVNTGTLYQ
ncbi:MAG: SPFH domain-containing protein [Acidobacteriota bacterium]|nr:SPFH domain-containing protein [Acidobacteriota bacterium]